MSSIVLKPIDESNFLDAFALEPTEGQEKYVSHPIRSLAQAYVYRTQCQPFGIYREETMVGYVMVIYDYDIPEYDIRHLMIDRRYQHQGYSRKAMEAVLDYIREKPFGDSDRVALTCDRENAPTLHLCETLGFAPTGAEDGDEIELSLTLYGSLPPVPAVRHFACFMASIRSCIAAAPRLDRPRQRLFR